MDEITFILWILEKRFYISRLAFSDHRDECDEGWLPHCQKTAEKPKKESGGLCWTSVDRIYL